MTLIAIAFLLLGGGCALASILALIRGLRSRSWPTVQGVVSSARTFKKLNSDADEVSRQTLEYSYSVNGRKYRSSRVRFGLPAALAWSAGPARAFRRGDDVLVFHSPSRPSISALQPGPAAFVFLPLAAGAAMLWAGVRLLF